MNNNVFISIILLIAALYGVFSIYIELATDELKAQRRLNKEYTQYCQSLTTCLPLQVYQCGTKNEFDRWESTALGYMELILDQHNDFIRNLPSQMQALYREYKAYSAQTTLLYQHMDGMFLPVKQRRFKKRIQAPPDNIVMRVHVTYTSPRGRNSYSARYEMQYKDAILYLKTFPTAENTYLPDAFIRQNNKLSIALVHMYYVIKMKINTTLDKQHHFNGACTSILPAKVILMYISIIAPVNRSSFICSR